ncbi:DUF1028 domain-containing protein [Egibacter rhizosphaerae]|uniref:DUF1028 domain-containing protein n=1 Tax=Egibacter rhizosphaerae TaxID=1670831 RepID=A0A411YGL5_9ACTN|nr:DUF1028 domain-containing protein [Egibacter rhizosphaerae]QBI20317.1 DUF1028 domain-containing protein [Egibacter rhizosphaerae]
MTLSIVARCPETGQLGIAAATGTPGVGKLLTWAEPHAGAIATQGWVNPYLGADGIDLLAHGHPAHRVLGAVLTLDPAPEQRQIGVVDASGNVAHHTGEACEGWAGVETGDGLSVQGNLLQSGHGVTACRETFEASEGELVARLLAALAAGVTSGGDHRGERSATVYVVEAERYPIWDVRIDESHEPVAELERLQGVLHRELMSQLRLLPTRRDPRGRTAPPHREGLA